MSIPRNEVIAPFLEVKAYKKGPYKRKSFLVDSSCEKESKESRITVGLYGVKKHHKKTFDNIFHKAVEGLGTIG